MNKKTIHLKLNGEPREWSVFPNELLLNVIREQEMLTGAKYGCGIGECGACSVIVNDQVALSCLTLAIAVEGAEITTVEGLVKADGELDPVQAAFLDYTAYQCGYCTPAMIVVARTLLDENPQPTEMQVREYMRGNLCRCTGYASIVRAVLAAAEKEKHLAH